MASVGQVYYNVLDKNNGNRISNITSKNLFEGGGNVVSAVSASRFTKIGIQAKPGTMVVMNESKEIMIGQSGIYELDEGIAVTSLYFIKPKKYQLDEEGSAKAIADGAEAIRKAEEAKAKSLIVEVDGDILVLVNGSWISEPDRETEPELFAQFWDIYNSAQNTFKEEYESAYNTYQTGVNGIYTLPNPGNLESAENYDDLYDVIIDFIWE